MVLWWPPKLAFVVLVAALLGCILPCIAAHVHTIKGHRVGDKITFQCLKQGQWTAGPICAESGQEMSFTYGVDTFVSCGWRIQNESDYNFLASLVQRQQHWTCRMAMVSEVPEGHDWYVYFTIPLSGVVEGSHMHVDNHLNFIFHAASGRIIGMAAYSVRDRLQTAKQGSTITMHGPAKW